jgi:aspartyl-tRNA(Asn)/glutamyl-tRNA(Gln) amidotransferase subunit C
MKISIEHLSRLARLSLSDEEKALYESQLNGILTYMETLNGLDTKDVEPTSHVIELVNVERDDTPRPCLGREEALMNAPDRTEKFYRVPKIIE